MFRPRPMIQVDILLLRTDLQQATRALAEAGLLHLRKVEEGRLTAAPSREQKSRLAKFRAFEDQVGSLMKRLGAPPRGGSFLDIHDFPVWKRWAEDLSSKVRNIRRRRAQLDGLADKLGDLRAFLIRMKEIEGDFSELTSLHFSHLEIGHLSMSGLSQLKAEPGRCSIHLLDRHAEEAVLAILTARTQREALRKKLQSLHFHRLELPATLAGTFADALDRITHLERKVRERLANLERRLAGLREENLERLNSRLQTVAAERLLLEAEETFGYSDRAAMLRGWLPAGHVKELKAALDEVCPGRYVLHRLKARGNETPVLLQNPLLIRPFQRILRAFDTPSYGEVEPTPLLAFGFLVMFGMMFGDLGHGLVFLAAGLGLRRVRRFRDEGLILAEVGVFAAFFGVLFGSFFGVEGLLPALWFSPLHDIARLMAAALALGIAIILAGLLLQIRNGLREKRLREVLTERYGVAGTVFFGGGVLSLLLAYRGLLPPKALLWLALPLAAVFLHPLAAAEKPEWKEIPLLLTEGLVEVLETVLGYLANTFSFLRLAAFGLAHVGLSLAVFALADHVHAVPLGDLWATLVHLLGNLIILVLEGLVVSIQAVRLQFYEFFSKFFRGGGVPYRPLSLGIGMERRG